MPRSGFKHAAPEFTQQKECMRWNRRTLLPPPPPKEKVMFSKQLPFDLDTVGLHTFSSFISSSGTFIPFTADAATIPSRFVSYNLPALNRTDVRRATLNYTLFKQDYGITFYGIHVFLKLMESRVFIALHILIKTAVVHGYSRDWRCNNRPKEIPMLTDKLNSPTGFGFLLMARETYGRELLVISCIWFVALSCYI